MIYTYYGKIIIRLQSKTTETLIRSRVQIISIAKVNVFLIVEVKK